MPPRPRYFVNFLDLEMYSASRGPPCNRGASCMKLLLVLFARPRKSPRPQILSYSRKGTSHNNIYISEGEMQGHFFRVGAMYFLVGVGRRHSVGYRCPGRTAILSPLKVLRCLMPPYFCRPLLRRSPRSLVGRLGVLTLSRSPLPSAPSAAYGLGRSNGRTPSMFFASRLLCVELGKITGFEVDV